ncbi:Hypp9328 [Branchiostoma lanceolatum]|uniref:Hypp9328 protein n=1 Tax=Branchiostoma lanceolatum TaxID=7740 RepID=A0A8S4MME8_BRALA|nr:Hypp9328 [Branchiostoma lanceolatum]
MASDTDEPMDTECDSDSEYYTAPEDTDTDDTTYYTAIEDTDSSDDATPAALREYQEANFVKLCKVCSKTVEARNRRLPDSAPRIPSEHVYAMAEFGCIHDGQAIAKKLGRQLKTINEKFCVRLAVVPVTFHADTCIKMVPVLRHSSGTDAIAYACQNENVDREATSRQGAESMEHPRQMLGKRNLKEKTFHFVHRAKTSFLNTIRARGDLPPAPRRETRHEDAEDINDCDSSDTDTKSRADLHCAYQPGIR